MPRQQGISVQNNFVKGLITEATALSFPENACTEASNIVFDPTGRVSRRLGFDIETSATNLTYGTADGDAYTTFIWNAVAGSGDISFLVVQSGNTLRFYNTSASTDTVSGTLHATTISTTTFLANQSDNNPALFECQFASGNGDLFVTNPACDPFYVTYDSAADSLTATEIDMSNRDFLGLEDNLGDNERPVYANVAALAAGNPNHEYNIMNQGWHQNDCLTHWDTTRADMPSNCDYVALYRNSPTDPFDPNRVTFNDPGNRLAPKGHFILNVANPDRQAAADSTAFVFSISDSSSSMIDGATGTIFTNFTLRSSAAFDGNLIHTEDTAARRDSATSGYIGKNFGTSTKSINRCIIYPCTDGNSFLDDLNFPMTITLYGKNSLPVSGTDGTVLGSTSVPSTTSTSKTIISTDPLTQWQYVWVNLVPTSSDAILVAELQFFSGSLSFERPSCVQFYAGRVFYGGISTSELANNIYFSQIITKKDQYGKCYQQNDPTSELIPDLLSDDGGVIKIPEMGTLKKLFSYQSALLAFATNGVWLISGSSGSTFKADDYVVKKISSIGITSPQSVCSIKGLPAWWGEDGIYTVTFDPNYDSFTPVSLTLQTLDRFYTAIPAINKKFAKATYDETNQIAYWIYNSGTLSIDKYRYDSVLALDGKSKAFYTWTISTGPIVRSIDYVKSAMRTSDPKLKFQINPSYDGTITFSSTQTFAEITSTTYRDWVNEGHNTDYTSYFVTGYRLDGQTQKFFQANYVFVFLDQETDSSCFMQAVFDFTTSGDSGKWSSQQQVVKSSNLNRSINFRKLKIRGKGRALQLRFEGETGKPFTIIGWSISESTNTGI